MNKRCDLSSFTRWFDFHAIRTQTAVCMHRQQTSEAQQNSLTAPACVCVAQQRILPVAGAQQLRIPGRQQVGSQPGRYLLYPMHISHSTLPAGMQLLSMLGIAARHCSAASGNSPADKQQSPMNKQVTLFQAQVTHMPAKRAPNAQMMQPMIVTMVTVLSQASRGTPLHSKRMYSTVAVPSTAAALGTLCHSSMTSTAGADKQEWQESAGNHCRLYQHSVQIKTVLQRLEPQSTSSTTYG